MRWEGIVTSGDGTRCNDDGDDLGAVFIGDSDIVDELAEEQSKPSTVSINGQVVATGVISGEQGWGYSAYTPMESDALIVRKNGDRKDKAFDLIAAILAHEGESIVLEIIEDKP